MVKVYSLSLMGVSMMDIGEEEYIMDKDSSRTAVEQVMLDSGMMVK
jgi:hypothetical protein